MYYLSIDVEASGPFPGLFSLVSIGAVPVFKSKGKWTLLEGADFYLEVQPLEGAGEVPAATAIHGLSADYLRASGKPPGEAMQALAEYLRGMGKRLGKCVAAAWPASFDSPYVGWYCQKYLGENPLGYGAFDIASYAQGMFRCGKGELRQRMLSLGFPIQPNPTPHNALHDAREQAQLLAWLLNYPMTRTPIPVEESPSPNGQQ